MNRYNTIKKISMWWRPTCLEWKSKALPGWLPMLKNMFIGSAAHGKSGAAFLFSFPAAYYFGAGTDAGGGGVETSGAGTADLSAAVCPRFEPVPAARSRATLANAM